MICCSITVAKLFSQNALGGVFAPLLANNLLMKPVSFPHSCREAALLKWFRLVFPGWDKSVSDDVKIFRCAANWTLAVVPAAFGQAGTPLDETQENMPMTLAAWGLEAWLGPLEAPHYCWAWKKIRFGTCSFNAVSHVCVMWLFHYRNQQLLMKLEASGIRKSSNFNFSLTCLSWIIKAENIASFIGQHGEKITN